MPKVNEPPISGQQARLRLVDRTRYISIDILSSITLNALQTI